MSFLLPDFTLFLYARLDLIASWSSVMIPVIWRRPVQGIPQQTEQMLTRAWKTRVMVKRERRWMNTSYRFCLHCIVTTVALPSSSMSQRTVASEDSRPTTRLRPMKTRARKISTTFLNMKSR